MTRARGFTLIEILLAATLFALLMSSYYVVFTRVVELEQYARNQRSFGSVGPSILDLIEDDLMSLHTHPRAPAAFPFRGEDDSMGSKAADTLNFVVRRQSVRQEDFFGQDFWVRSPVNEVGYRLASGDRALGDVRRLYRRESYYVDGSPLAGGDYYEVYDRVVEFDITYAGYAVEESERSSQDNLGEHELEKFESWDSEERKGYPTAVIIRLTIEPPRMTLRPAEHSDLAPERRTFVRVIPLVQAEDIEPPQNQPGSEDSTNPEPAAGPR